MTQSAIEKLVQGYVRKPCAGTVRKNGQPPRSCHIPASIGSEFCACHGAKNARARFLQRNDADALVQAIRQEVAEVLTTVAVKESIKKSIEETLFNATRN